MVRRFVVSREGNGETLFFFFFLFRSNLSRHGMAAPRGLTLAGWDALIAGYEGGRSAFEGKTTEWVKHHVIIPSTALPTAPSHSLTCDPAACDLPKEVPSGPALLPLAGGGASAAPATPFGAASTAPTEFRKHPSSCEQGGGSCGESYVDHLGEAPHVGTCNVFVSHAYTYKFLTVLETVRAWEVQQRVNGERGPFAYYFDLFQNNQHGGEKITFEALSSEFSRNIMAIGKTLLVLEWEKPEEVLKRAWCMFEIWTTVMVGAHFDIALSAEDRGKFLAALLDYEALDKISSVVDVFLATARRRRTWRISCA